MGKIRNPVLFSTHFKVDASRLSKVGVLDPVLNIDTKLFIDPLLISHDRHIKFSKNATTNFRNYFENVVKLLKAIRKPGDIAWRQAAAHLALREVKWTCLGYGSSSIRGRRSDRTITIRLVKTAKEIIDLGVEDPELFALLPLFEEGVGPDFISDLTTIAILPNLAEFTADICGDLGVKTTKFKIKDIVYRLPQNPTEKRSSPVLLVPRDILRALPVASDWAEVADAASQNAEIRNRVNRLIGNIWEAKTRKEKAKLRASSLSSRDAFNSLLDAVCKTAIRPYNLETDPEGLLKWRSVYQTVASIFPLSLTLVSPPTPQTAVAVVQKIVDHFRSLIEDKGLWKILWYDDKPHREKVAQMLFFAVSDAYCKANSIDVTPEADTGSGPVDFKFAAGYEGRVLVEVKLSTNHKLVSGYTVQLETYKASQKPVHAIYLVIDVGGMGDKDEKLISIKNDWKAKKPVSEIVFVDGTQKKPASKR